MQAQSDIVALGGGPAGVAAARAVARLGGKAMLIDTGKLGGIGAYGGTVPARALARAARLKRESEQLGLYGLEAPPAVANVERLMARLREVGDHLHRTKEIADRARTQGMEVREHLGSVRFTSPETVVCGNGLEVTGRKFIVRVGGHSRRLPTPGFDLSAPLSDIWTLKALPGSIAIVGAGRRVARGLHLGRRRPPA